MPKVVQIDLNGLCEDSGFGSIALADLMTYDRHGSFFEFKFQWYFICNDFSRPGATEHFRDSAKSHLHFRENGEIAPLRLDRTGVRAYFPFL